MAHVPKSLFALDQGLLEVLWQKICYFSCYESRLSPQTCTKHKASNIPDRSQGCRPHTVFIDQVFKFCSVFLLLLPHVLDEGTYTCSACKEGKGIKQQLIYLNEEDPVSELVKSVGLYV